MSLKPKRLKHNLIGKRIYTAPSSALACATAPGSSAPDAFPWRGLVGAEVGAIFSELEPPATPIAAGYQILIYSIFPLQAFDRYVPAHGRLIKT
jgi:hypothetical protein